MVLLQHIWSLFFPRNATDLCFAEFYTPVFFKIYQLFGLDWLIQNRVPLNFGVQEVVTSCGVFSV